MSIPDPTIKIARNTKIQEIKDDLDHLYRAFKPIVDKHMKVEDLKAECLRLADQYIDLPVTKRHVTDGMPVAGAIFFVATRKLSSSIKKGLITVKEIEIATQYSAMTIRRVLKKLEMVDSMMA